jgi:hypothetical protein
MSKLVKTEVPAAVTIPVVVRFSLPKLIAPELSVTLPEPTVSVPAVKAPTFILAKASTNAAPAPAPSE